jgi:hypothetical protein
MNAYQAVRALSPGSSRAGAYHALPAPTRPPGRTMKLTRYAEALERLGQ